MDSAVAKQTLSSCCLHFYYLVLICKCEKVLEVSPFLYVTAATFFIQVNYIAPAIVVLLLFVCFQLQAYVSASNLPCMILLLFLYGFAITPMMYPASFYFTVRPCSISQNL